MRQLQAGIPGFFKLLKPVAEISIGCKALLYLKTLCFTGFIQ
jgi:hypothetical protein